MALPVYPASLPFAPTEWDMEPIPPLIATEMEGGNFRARRRPGDNYYLIKQTIEYTSAQYTNVFEPWLFKTVAQGGLNHGSSRFTGLRVYLGGTGFGASTVVCQFDPRAQPNPRVAYNIVSHRGVAMTLIVYR